MYTVLKGGYNSRHLKNFIMQQPNGIDSFIILIVKSPARFLINKKTFTITYPSAIIIRPQIPYEYSGLNAEYKNDYIRFDCSDASFEGKYGHLFERPIPLSNSLHYTQYVQHILWECNYTPAKYRQDNISMLFQVMLNKLSQEYETAHLTKPYTVYASKLQALRLTMLSQPYKKYTAAELAASLNVSASYFQHLYKEIFEIPFKTDLINMRLDYAQALITNTTQTLEEIALASGYTNEIHFYRQFKAKTGMTPREYAAAMQRITVGLHSEGVPDNHPINERL